MNEQLEPVDTERQPIAPILGVCSDCGEPVTQETFAAAFATGDVLCLGCAAEYTLPNDGDGAGLVG